MKYICIILFFSFLSISCKNKNFDKNYSSKEIIKDNIFSVDLKIKMLENDRLQLFYVQADPESDFSAEKRVYLDVKGKGDFQVVSFKLPSDVLPYRFRIDLGENKIESNIQIQSLVIKLNDGVLIVDSSNFHRLFSSNIYLNTSDNINFSRKKIKNQYDPYILSTPLLDKIIEMDLN